MADKQETCTSCDGKGYVEVTTWTPDGKKYNHNEVCSSCGGKGKK